MSPATFKKYMYLSLLAIILLLLPAFAKSARNMATRPATHSHTAATETAKVANRARHQLLVEASPSSMEKVSLLSYTNSETTQNNKSTGKVALGDNHNSKPNWLDDLLAPLIPTQSSNNAAPSNNDEVPPLPANLNTSSNTASNNNDNSLDNLLAPLIDPRTAAIERAFNEEPAPPAKNSMANSAPSDNPPFQGNNPFAGPAVQQPASDAGNNPFAGPAAQQPASDAGTSGGTCVAWSINGTCIEIGSGTR